jgi:hypothetical protein
MNVGILRIAESIPSGSKVPDILVVQRQCSQAELSAENPLFGSVTSAIIKDSIFTCELEHDHSCSPNNPDTIQGLKIFDCEQKKIVHAPRGCRYVALSYVWGQNNINRDVGTSMAHNKLPRTVSDSCLIATSLGYRYLWVDRIVSE